MTKGSIDETVTSTFQIILRSVDIVDPSSAGFAAPIHTPPLAGIY